MKNLTRLLILVALVGAPLSWIARPVHAADKEDKARFYDFSDQLIDGDIKKPTALYMESRTRAKFEKLLKLKKSFRPAMVDTSKERILK